MTVLRMAVSGGVDSCCEEWQAAVELTFANPYERAPGWLLYGTDRDTVSAGQPELRYWPVRYCPFCGALLPADPRKIRG